MKNRAIIVDLDGTLALLNGRDPYKTEDCNFDEVNFPLRVILHAIVTSFFYTIIIVTGREEKHRELTAGWLEDNAIPYSKIYMRPDGDETPGYELKQIILNRTILPEQSVFFALEDDPRCVKMYRENGIPCFQVADWQPFKGENNG